MEDNSKNENLENDMVDAKDDARIIAFVYKDDTNKVHVKGPKFRRHARKRADEMLD